MFSLVNLINCIPNLYPTLQDGKEQYAVRPSYILERYWKG